MYLIRSACMGLFAAMLVLPTGASAGERDERGSTQQSPAGADRAVSGFGIAASSELLERARGGSDSIASNTRLNGTVSGNAATDVNTGSNVIQASSFANVTGIPIVIQNSGANVLIQNATVINLQFN
jgi:hypothetical protein